MMITLPTGRRGEPGNQVGVAARRCWYGHQQTNRRAQEDTSMAPSAHGTVRGRRLGLAGRRWTAVGTLHRPKEGVTWPACDVCY